MKLAAYQSLAGIAYTAYGLGERAGRGTHHFGKYFHSANKRLSDAIRGFPPLRAVPSNLSEKDMNGGIGPQDNAGGTHAGAPFAQKEATTNFNDVVFPISYTGVSNISMSFSDSSTHRGQILFTPTGGTGWNTSFLAPVSNALDVFNYYVLESVEFIWLTNAFNSGQNQPEIGHSIFKIIPWTAEYTVGGVFPGTDISLLNECETFFVRVITGTVQNYEPTALDFQRTEHTNDTIVKPMYQQNTEPTSPNPNIKAQYATIPLQIASANGIDNTTWYSLLYEFNCSNAVTGPITIRAPFMYRVSIGLSGRRFVNVSTLFRRQAYLLGNNNVGALSNRT